MPNFWDASFRLDLLLSKTIGEMTAMDRLSEKLAKAAGVAKRATDRIEARADALIAREGDLEKRTEAVFSPHEGILADAEKGLDAVERSLALLSNDPLGSSGESSAGQPAPVAQRAFDRIG